MSVSDFTSPIKKYKIIQGDTFGDGFYVTEWDENTQAFVPKDLTGVEIISTIKGGFKKDLPVLAQCVEGDGIEVTDGDGTMDFVSFKYIPSKTNTLPTKTVYMDLQFKFSSTESYTFLRAEIEVEGQATPHA
jgi:hypothetical protein